MTAAPETTKTPETTAPETTAAKSHNLKVEYLTPFPKTKGVEEPFYWIDETHIGVRGFDEVVLSANGQYLTAIDLTGGSAVERELGCNGNSREREFVLTEKPAVCERADAFPFSERESVHPSSFIVRFSDNCVFQVIHWDGPRTRVVTDLILEKAVLYEDEKLLPTAPYESFSPIFKSSDGKTVVYLNYESISVLNKAWFSIRKATLDNDLRYIERIEELNGFSAYGFSAVSLGVWFDGAYGFAFFNNNSYTDENGVTTNYYSFAASKDYGVTWVILDPERPGLPELTLTKETGEDGTAHVTLTSET